MLPQILGDEVRCRVHKERTQSGKTAQTQCIRKCEYRQSNNPLLPVGRRYLLMGTKPRHRPERLAEKLLQIRNSLGLSQTELLKRLGVEDVIAYHRISEYESGKREPSLVTLSRYAEVAGVCTDVLILDELDLPAKLPSKPKHKS